MVDQCRMEVNHQRECKTAEPLQFLKEGEKTKPSKLARTNSVLSTIASDRQLLVDVQKKLRFPEEIAATSMRPDMLLISRESKTIHIVELTVPWEDRLNISHELKTSKYQNDKAHTKGRCQLRFDVGAFQATTTRNFLRKVGLSPTTTKKAINTISDSVESSSRCLWIKRRESWNPANHKPREYRVQMHIPQPKPVCSLQKLRTLRYLLVMQTRQVEHRPAKK